MTETSRFLSYVLRHEPQAIGLTLDPEGWAEVDAIIEGAAKGGRTLDRELIREVVATSDKKRFAISGDGLRIRAVQGHSTESVSVSHPERVPPDYLYHGTATRFLQSILGEGLKPGKRHHVHLSEDAKAAIVIGRRYGKPIVLRIQALRMHEEGFKFFQAENAVWLTEAVPPRFLAVHEREPPS